jgi:hypothetical protein
MANVKFYEPALDRLLNSPAGEVGKHLRRRGLLILAGAKGQVGVKTGALRASLHMRHLRDTRGQYITVGSQLPYARMHHEGTRPHIIRPNRAQVLVFRTRGQIVYSQMVRHPGTRPNRYLTDNMRRFV